ncbi:serine/threonine protein kinase [Planctomicrobium sp. SH664]|uniref:serine/threonine protein kinase n=1 Tax=Planctomicrobium sp. SH664 TaxID=3448125 RepID=UPI003F5C2D77
MDRDQKSSSAGGSGAHDLTPVQNESGLDTSRRQSLRKGEVPATVAGYEIIRPLGEGSFGTVWLGRERKTGRQVAIKFFTKRNGLDWTLLTREVEKLAVLDASRDVVRLLDVGVDHDPPYFVMEYLPHRSVAVLLESGPVPVDQALEITRSVARALVHAHSAGILHCDIKPGNVLLDHGDSARLGDFGQSRLATEMSSSLGTFYYMAPEQAQKNAIPDVRWDVYALGALLYHMLTGTPPYRTEETEEQLQTAKSLDERLELYRHLIATSPFPADHHVVPGVDAALIEIIDNSLHRDPLKRTAHPQMVLDALERREMNRAKRPYVWIGILVPVLFLLASLWIAGNAIPAAVRQAEHNLAVQALASEQATAQLLASSVQGELLDRQADLERLAARLTVRDDPKAATFRPDLMETLDRWREQTDERYLKQQRTLDESIFLTDHNGVQLYRSPWSDSVGRSFAYRDYFHGLGHELSATRDDIARIEPRKVSGISQAYRSTSTGHFMVAIAVPVWNAERTEVIGVLGRTLPLNGLLDQWERRIRGARPEEQPADDWNRLLSLIDMRQEPPLILDHHWMGTHELRRMDEEAINMTLRLTPAEKRTIRQALKSHRGIENYVDPVADADPQYDQSWLAAVAAIPDIDWVAVVQERQDLAVAPMSQLYWVFLRYGLLLLLVFASTLLALWWFIKRAAQL